MLFFDFWLYSFGSSFLDGLTDFWDLASLFGDLDFSLLVLDLASSFSLLVLDLASGFSLLVLDLASSTLASPFSLFVGDLLLLDFLFHLQ